MRIDGNRVSAQATPFRKCPTQMELISIRLLASVGRVSSIRVRGAAPSASSNGLAEHQCCRTLRNWMRARHNTQLCGNRPVTEAGLPAEGIAGCMSVLLCRVLPALIYTRPRPVDDWTVHIFTRLGAICGVTERLAVEPPVDVNEVVNERQRA